MIGPSSSHTAGAVRLGALARAVFGFTPAVARIRLHGSFASTGLGHGTDLALIAGLLGMGPDDERIPSAQQLAREAGMTVEFSETDLGEVHPNTADFELEAEGGERMSLRGSSLGGGEVVITSIDGFDVTATGELPMLVVEHTDRPGVVAGVTGVLAGCDANIAEMRVSRERRGARALMLIETDFAVTDACAEMVARQPGVSGVRRIPAL
jgi:L-serine dehydratase